MNISHFYAMLSRMRYINRWGLMNNTRCENLSEHSLDVAVIAHCLVLIHNKRFGGNLNAERAALLALFHDATEIITGDMPTPVKYNNPALKSAYKDLEKTADEKLLSMLPDFLREEYERYFNVDISSDEGRLIKAADKISAYIKCVEETLSGNGEFAIAEKTTLNAIDVDLPEVKYFMDNCLEGFFKPLDVLK